MLKFMRNKVVNVTRKGRDNLAVHGILDDDIYSIELDVLVRLEDLEILAIEGKWHRWTTPECPRATQFLREAVGFRVGEEGFGPKVHKVVGRKACRHFANLLLECCHCAGEAAAVLARGTAEPEDRSPASGESGSGAKTERPLERPSPAKAERISAQPVSRAAADTLERAPNGMTVDLHVHTSPASPCSSAPVDSLIEEAMRIGLDAICLTDHNHVWDPVAVEELRQKHGFLVLRGNEITTNHGDVLVFGFDEPVHGIIDLAELRREVQKVDGFMIVAHPFRGFLVVGVDQVGLSPEKAKERPVFGCVDAVEVLNGKVTERENAFALKVAGALELPVTGGSDAHEVHEVGVYATEFAHIIRDERDLVAALREGNYSAVVFRKGGPIGLQTSAPRVSHT